MAIPLFVCGTLKQGFPNSHLHTGRCVPCRVITREVFPTYVVRLPAEDRAPWLLDLPGQGHRVLGEVYEVDAAALSALDALQEVGQPTGHVRVPVVLQSLCDPAQALQAQAYLRSPAQLSLCLACEGPYAEYTLTLARGYYLHTPTA